MALEQLLRDRPRQLVVAEKHLRTLRLRRRVLLLKIEALVAKLSINVVLHMGL